MKNASLFVALWATAASAQAAGVMRITEYMYNGAASNNIGEFVEFTNVGDAPVNMAGWSFDDSSRAPGSQSLTAFGIVQPWQSVILTDDTVANFRTQWGLTSTAVIGGNVQNLSRGDEINLYDASNNLIDRLTYDDQTLGGPRTNKTSAWTTLTHLGSNDPTKWQLSVAGDAQHSWTTAAGDLGNPGTYVPEPMTLSLLAAGCFGLVRRPGRRQ